MSGPNPTPKQPAPADDEDGFIVEDTTRAGGRDRTTGADVIRGKSAGHADRMNEATDARENSPKPA